MKRVITMLLLLISCAAVAETITIIAPDGTITTCIKNGPIVQCL